MQNFCFAYIRGEPCQILRVRICMQPSKCAFFQTKEQLKAGRLKSKERLERIGGITQ